MRDGGLLVFGEGSGEERTFLVTDSHGATVSARLDEAELSEAYPELHSLYRTALVEDEGLDARVDLEVLEHRGRIETKD
jgi:hypothetical protein